MEPSKHGASLRRSRRSLARRSCRVRAHLDLRIQFTNGRPVDGIATDISVGGMFVVCPAPVDVGANVSITWPADDARPLEVTGTVRWTKTSGFGVQFGLLGARETHALVEIVVAARLANGLPSSRRR